MRASGAISSSPPGCVVLAIQPSAIVDTLRLVDELPASMRSAPGGSQRVTGTELNRLLAAAGPDEDVWNAGGSAANMLRALSEGFGLRVGVVGAAGCDAAGMAFAASLRASGVDTSLLLVQPCATGRCAVFVEPCGQRTMRTALQSCATLTNEDVRRLHDACAFDAVPWLSFTAYSFYTEGLAGTILRAAEANGCGLVLHLASRELVRSHRDHLLGLLDVRFVEVVFCNEDEAAELGGGCHRRGLALLAARVPTAVVTLGAAGAVAQRGAARVHCPAVDPGAGGVADTAGCGDAFAAGFLCGLSQGRPLDLCLQLGCIAGAAVAGCHGAAAPPGRWRWARDRVADLLQELGELEAGASQAASCPPG